MRRGIGVLPRGRGKGLQRLMACRTARSKAGSPELCVIRGVSAISPFGRRLTL